MATISFDIHTHTFYSHGKGTIEENAAEAEKKGLTLLGIADHGPGHIGYGISMKDLPKMRKDLEEARKNHPGLEIQLGVEANIMNPSGHLDVKEEDKALFDYIIAGYHYGVLGEAPIKAVMVHLGGYWYEATGKYSSRALVYNTDLAVKALENNNIKIITHPGDKAAFDIAEIAKACERTGTLMEINGHHKCLSVEGIRTAAEYDVSFILSSDAHLPANVANVEEALKRVEAAGLPLERIVNIRR